MISKHGAFLLAIAAALPIACDVGVSVQTAERDDHPPSVRAFAEAMEKGDVETFVADLNNVRMDPEPEVLTYLVSVWRDARGEDPSRLLRNDLVLTELAWTLAQARRNPAVDVDEAELREFLRTAIRSDDEDVRLRAVLGIATLGDPIDMPILGQMTADPDETIFSAAVLVLSSRCVPEARAELDRIGPLLSKKRAAFVAETRRTDGC
jgi:HEAT repeat protein